MLNIWSNWFLIQSIFYAASNWFLISIVYAEIMVYFYTSSSLIYILEIHRRKFQTPSDEGIMESNYKFVMLWNFSVIGQLIFPQCFFLLLVQNLKNNLRGDIINLLWEQHQKIFYDS